MTTPAPIFAAAGYLTQAGLTLPLMVTLEVMGVTMDRYRLMEPGPLVDHQGRVPYLPWSTSEYDLPVPDTYGDLIQLAPGALTVQDPTRWGVLCQWALFSAEVNHLRGWIRWEAPLTPTFGTQVWQFIGLGNRTVQRHWVVDERPQEVGPWHSR